MWSENFLGEGVAFLFEVSSLIQKLKIQQIYKKPKVFEV